MTGRVGDHPDVQAAARRLRRYRWAERLLASLVAAGAVMLATVAVVVLFVHVV